MRLCLFFVALLMGCSIITDPDSFEGDAGVANDGAVDAPPDAPPDALPDTFAPCGGECPLDLPFCDESTGICGQCLLDGDCPSNVCAAGFCLDVGESICCPGGDCTEVDSTIPLLVSRPTIDGIDAPELAPVPPIPNTRLAQLVQSPAREFGWWIIEQAAFDYRVTPIGFGSSLSVAAALDAIRPDCGLGPDILDVDVSVSNGQTRAGLIVGSAASPPELVTFSPTGCSKRVIPMPLGHTTVSTGALPAAFTIVNGGTGLELERNPMGPLATLNDEVIGMDDAGGVGVVAYRMGDNVIFAFFDDTGIVDTRPPEAIEVDGPPRIAVFDDADESFYGVFYSSAGTLVVDYYFREDGRFMPLIARDSSVATTASLSAVGLAEVGAAAIATPGGSAAELVFFDFFGGTEGRFVSADDPEFTRIEAPGRILAVDVKRALRTDAFENYTEVAAVIRGRSRTQLVRWRVCEAL